MPCNYPMPAWKTHAGTVVLNKSERQIRNVKEQMQLPCGACAGCRKAKAQEWTLRCLLELQEHRTATFTTLTYDDQYLPETLQWRDMQLFLKRLRKSAPPCKQCEACKAEQRCTANKLRFFACGEYGEKKQRPHYHAILFGISATEDAGRIKMAWHQGFTTNEAVTPARIAYTAGYVQKKYGEPKPLNAEYVNYETGEVYEWQQPFIQMSRGGRTGHGIGGSARRHTASWRDFAILNGTRMPVPKYLHEAWKEATTGEEREEKEHEQYLRKLTKERITTRQLEAQEAIINANNRLQAERRNKH